MSISDVRREMNAVFKDKARVTSVTLTGDILTISVMVRGDTTETTFTKRLGPSVQLSDGLPSVIAKEILDARNIPNPPRPTTSLPEVTKTIRPIGKFGKVRSGR